MAQAEFHIFEGGLFEGLARSAVSHHCGHHCVEKTGQFFLQGMCTVRSCQLYQAYMENGSFLQTRQWTHKPLEADVCGVSREE